MSLEICKTLDQSQQAILDDFYYKQDRQERFLKLMQTVCNEIAGNGLDAEAEKLQRLLRLQDRFFQRVIGHCYWLAEERNFCHFSMLDLEEVLFEQKNKP